MQSLRTRKPSEARPVTKTNGARSGTREIARKATRVDDKIKKRMSMRYADISSPTATSVPALPTVPLAFRPSGGAQRSQQDVYAVPDGEREREEQREDQREADLRMLDREEFDPDACERCCCYFCLVRYGY